MKKLTSADERELKALGKQIDRAALKMEALQKRFEKLAAAMPAGDKSSGRPGSKKRPSK